MRLGGKLGFWAHFVPFPVLLCPAIKSSRLPMNLQSWEGKTEIYMSWECKDQSQSKTGAGESK